MTKFYDCPRCGAKRSAKVSVTYHDAVIHKCDGKTLLEVGKFENGQVVALTTPVTTSSGGKMETRSFILERPKSVDELMRAGSVLKNLTQNKSDAERYFNKPNSSIFIVKRKLSPFSSAVPSVEYMVLVENGQIPDRAHFSGKDHAYIPQNDGSEILQKLIDERVISRNPFPLDYPT